MIVSLSLKEIMLLGVLVRDGQLRMDEHDDYTSDWFVEKDVEELVDKINYLDDRARYLADEEENR